MNADPKPSARVVDKDAGKEKVAREGRCRVTGTPQNLTRFHLVGRDLGGGDVDENIVPICQPVHDFWEHHKDGKQLFGPMIWGALEDDERAYVLEKKSTDFVRRYYGVEL
jgi:hypothetical protein